MLALNGVRRLIYTAGFDGPEGERRVHRCARAAQGAGGDVGCGAGRQRAQGDAQSTTWAMAGRFDLSKLLAAVRLGIEQFAADSKG